MGTEGRRDQRETLAYPVLRGRQAILVRLVRKGPEAMSVRQALKETRGILVSGG